MKKLFTLLTLILFLVSFSNAQEITTELISPNTSSVGTTQTVEIKVSHNHTQAIFITIDLKDDNNNITTVANNVTSGIPVTYIFNLPAAVPVGSVFKLTIYSNSTTNRDLAVGSPLPVQLINFTASVQGNHALLQWATASEKDNSHFVLQRSLNGLVFDSIATITGHGTTNSPKNYSHQDKTVQYNTLYYYRLKQVDFNGHFTYSNIISFNSKNHPIPYPVNVNNNSRYTMNINSGETVESIVVLGVNGNKIYENKFPNNSINTTYSGIGIINVITDKNVYKVKALIQ